MALLSGAGQGHDGNVLGEGGNKTTELGICTSISLQLRKRSLAGGKNRQASSIEQEASSIICSGERLEEAPLLCRGEAMQK